MNGGSAPSTRGTLSVYVIVAMIIALIVALDVTGYLPGSSRQGSVTGNRNCLWTPYLSQNKTATFYVPIRAMVASPANSSVVYLGTFFGVIVGTNSSAFSYRWRYVTDERIDMTGLVIVPHPPFLLYTFGHPVTNVDTGIRESCDGGQSWTTLVTRPDPHRWVVSESNSSIMYATDYPTNVFVTSEDGGRSWKVLPSPSTVFTISIRPDDPLAVLVGTGEGLYVSRDGGSSWTPFALGAIRGNTSAVCYDPFNSQVIYAATSLGVMKTADGGQTWNNISNGLGSGVTIQQIAVDPHDSEVVYAASISQVYKSVDGGTNWNPILG